MSKVLCPTELVTNSFGVIARQGRNNPCCCRHCEERSDVAILVFDRHLDSFHADGKIATLPTGARNDGPKPLSTIPMSKVKNLKDFGPWTLDIGQNYQTTLMLPGSPEFTRPTMAATLMPSSLSVSIRRSILSGDTEMSKPPDV